MDSSLTFTYLTTKPDKYQTSKNRLIFQIDEDTAKLFAKNSLPIWEHEGNHFFTMKYPKTYQFSLEKGQEIQCKLHLDSFNDHPFVRFPNNVLDAIAQRPKPKKLVF